MKDDNSLIGYTEAMKKSADNLEAAKTEQEAREITAEIFRNLAGALLRLNQKS